MGKCNRCESNEISIHFNVDGDFGYGSDYDSMHFSFKLCNECWQQFKEKGEEIEEEFDYYKSWDYCFKDDLKFSTKVLDELLSSFKYVPDNYYNDGYHIYTSEEEQLLWDNRNDNLGILDLVDYERFLELKEHFDEEWVESVMKTRFNDINN